MPEYSQAVQSARASGNVLSERATIIRETVKFFLVYKYWWTSDDYDRIAELVVNEFPELRDPFTWPSQPCYVRCIKFWLLFVITKSFIDILYLLTVL